MCNISERWLEHGIERGLQQGIEQGEIKGRQAANKEIAIKLLKQGQDFNFIADLCDLSVEEVEELKKSMN